MAVFGGIAASDIRVQAQSRLMTLRMALEAAHDYQLWLSGLSNDDLVAAGMSSDDAQSLKNAFADADGLWNIANDGTPVEGLPYNFLASARIIIGPLF
jgi:hypothetical protein